MSEKDLRHKGDVVRLPFAKFDYERQTWLPNSALSLNASFQQWN